MAPKRLTGTRRGKMASQRLTGTRRGKTVPKRLKGARREAWEDGPIVEILSRLPVKSICKFRTVCKSWNGLTSNKDFAKRHFAHRKDHPSFISCPDTDTMRFCSVNPGSLVRMNLNRVIPDERCHEGRMHMISSFNGLICCLNLMREEAVEEGFDDLQIWICNPCTGEKLLLPQGTPSFKVMPSVGVAYTSDSSEYRVFRIFCTGEKVLEEVVDSEEDLIENRSGLAYECEVYSSNTGSWRNIGTVDYVPMFTLGSHFRSSHIFVQGKVYWIVSLDRGGKILSVDMEGRFGVLELPEYPVNINSEDDITDCTFLINLKGSLAMVVQHPDYIDVWVRKRMRGKDEWYLLCEAKCPIREDNDEDVVAVSSLENKIIWLTTTHWRVFDVDARTWRRKMAPCSGFVNPSVFPFTPTLLTCDGSVTR